MRVDTGIPQDSCRTGGGVQYCSTKKFIIGFLPAAEIDRDK